MDLHGYKSLLVFGGSFDPPTLAHAKLPPAAAKAVGADVVLYVPTANPPHKKERQLTPSHHRLAMLRLALANVSNARILTDELERAAQTGKPSYTVETLESLRERIDPDAKLRLLIGTDQLRVLDTWREPERIMELAEPLVMVRPPVTVEGLLEMLPPGAGAEAGFDPQTWRSRFVNVERMDVSSTRVRERIKSGESVNGLVSPDVEKYIKNHKLYCETASER